MTCRHLGLKWQRRRQLFKYILWHLPYLPQAKPCSLGSLAGLHRASVSRARENVACGSTWECVSSGCRGEGTLLVLHRVCVKSVPKAQARHISDLPPKTQPSALHPKPPQIFTVLEPKEETQFRG